MQKKDKRKYPPQKELVYRFSIRVWYYANKLPRKEIIMPAIMNFPSAQCLNRIVNLSYSADKKSQPSPVENSLANKNGILKENPVQLTNPTVEFSWIPYFS